MKWRRIPSIKKLLLGTVLAGLTVASATAADMPAYPLPPPPPPPVGIPDCWTGFYFGPNLGYHAGQDSISASANPNGWLAPAADAIDSLTATWLTPRGTVVGGQMGFNWQLGNVVFGWEGDGQWLDGTSTRQIAVVSPFVAAGDFMQNSSAERAMATIRARLGWAFGTVMVYGTAGGAMGWFANTNTFAAFGGTALATLPSTTVRPGWTGGGGIEWKFLPAWSVKAEYLYFHMQNYNTIDPGLRRLRPEQRHRRPPQLHRQFRPRGLELAHHPVVRANGKKGHKPLTSLDFPPFRLFRPDKWKTIHLQRLEQRLSGSGTRRRGRKIRVHAGTGSPSRRPSQRHDLLDRIRMGGLDRTPADRDLLDQGVDRRDHDRASAASTRPCRRSSARRCAA